MVVCVISLDFFVLTWVGAKPAEQPYSTISLIGSSYWFAYFLVILPLLGITETPDEQPKTIEEDWNKKVNKSSKAKENPSKGGVPSNGGVYEPAE